MTFTRILVALGAFFALSAPIQAFELQHQGGTLSLDRTPQHVVTYDLAVLDTLDALGIPVAGVPRSTYTGTLVKYAATPVVGTLFEPDYAALEAREPDLIFSGSRSNAAVPELSRRAPTVSLPHDTHDFLASVRWATNSIGAAWGKADAARAALARMDERLAALHALAHGKSAAMLFVIRDTIIVHAPGDRFGYAYELTGLQPVMPPRSPQEANQPRPAPDTPEAAAAAAKRAAEVSAVAAADPDWLIVLDRGAINQGEKTAAATLARHPELGQTRAFKEGRVYYGDPNGWYVISAGVNNLTHIAQDLLAEMQAHP